MSERFHRVIHGDCLKVLPTITERIDAVVTDPPYGISVPGAVSVGPTGSRNMDFFEGDTREAPLERLRLALGVLARPGNFMAFCGHGQFGGIVAMLEGDGMTTRPFAWVKSCPVPAAPSMRWTSGFELAAYGFDGGSCFNANGAGLRPNVWTGDSYRHGQPGKVAHPTQKPIELMREIVERVTPEGGTVLDPFCGSGTTGVACKLTGRNFIGIEIDEGYCKIARRRIADAASLFHQEPA